MIAGKPISVAVDEFIPGNGNESFFGKITDENEYWPIILEKSWAKIFGSYSATEEGFVRKRLKNVKIYNF